MRAGATPSITAFDAKNRLGQLLDRVAAGEELVITRHGRAVARLVPMGKHTSDDVLAALEAFRQIRSSLAHSGKKFTRDEVRAWKNKGRK